MAKFQIIGWEVEEDRERDIKSHGRRQCTGLSDLTRNFFSYKLIIKYGKPIGWAPAK